MPAEILARPIDQPSAGRIEAVDAAEVENGAAGAGSPGEQGRDMAFEKRRTVDRPLSSQAEADGIGVPIPGKLRALRHHSKSSRS